MPPRFRGCTTTKDAIYVLELAEILPKGVHHYPKHESAAIAMYRNPWWCTVPMATSDQGCVYRRCDLDLNGCHHPTYGNTASGEIPWR